MLEPLPMKILLKIYSYNVILHILWDFGEGEGTRPQKWPQKWVHRPRNWKGSRCVPEIFYKNVPFVPEFCEILRQKPALPTILGILVPVLGNFWPKTVPSEWHIPISTYREVLPGCVGVVRCHFVPFLVLLFLFGCHFFVRAKTRVFSSASKTWNVLVQCNGIVWGMSMYRQVTNLLRQSPELTLNF